uniref:Vascular endothelial growth factor receptor 2-like n=1 Tax=Coturnix japonica TaxID=93934 RepID=A0A8C2U440_COTJA
MLLHHPVELLGVLLAGLLVPFKQAAEVERALQRRVAVVGSSVLLVVPLNITLIHSIQWERLNGTVSHPILQYERHNLTIHMPYIARAHLHASNGSLLLEDLQESDSGIYKVTVNRAERESLTVLLDVLKPVSHPQLWSSGLVAKASGEVVCEVAEGRADMFTWKKDGQMLPPNRSYHLSGSLSVLRLRMAKKSDCGSYSCNASNGISWQETSLNVTVAGLSPPLQDVLRISVVAVVFAAVSGWGIIFPVCQSEKLRISESVLGTAEHPVLSSSGAERGVMLWEEMVTNSCTLLDD